MHMLKPAFLLELYDFSYVSETKSVILSSESLGFLRISLTAPKVCAAAGASQTAPDLAIPAI